MLTELGNELWKDLVDLAQDQLGDLFRAQLDYPLEVTVWDLLERPLSHQIEDLVWDLLELDLRERSSRG